MRWMAAALVLLAAPALVAGQTMAEAAKKAKEAREKNAKAGVKTKSYTQDDVKTAPPLANDPKKPPAKTGVSPSYSAPSSGAGSSSAAGQSESAWRGRMAAAHRRIENARREYDYWNSYMLVPGEILVDAKDRPVITSIEQLQGKTAAAKRSLEAAESALATLEEDARKAGVPPGWLR